MAQEKAPHRIGNTVEAEVISKKGICRWGHQVGDKFELAATETGGICGWLYTHIYPYLVVLQMGGTLPAAWSDSPYTFEIGCPDGFNRVVVRLRRLEKPYWLSNREEGKS